MSEKKYKVLEVKGKDGLTVGSKVLKPGIVFTKKQWPYSDESLEAAIKNKRCEEVGSEKKSEKKKADKDKDK